MKNDSRRSCDNPACPDENKYPAWICVPCGRLYGHGSKFASSTMHTGACGVCGREDVPVTEPRDFGHLRDGWRNANSSKAVGVSEPSSPAAGTGRIGKGGIMIQCKRKRTASSVSVQRRVRRFSPIAKTHDCGNESVKMIIAEAECGCSRYVVLDSPLRRAMGYGPRNAPKKIRCDGFHSANAESSGGK